MERHQGALRPSRVGVADHHHPDTTGIAEPIETDDLSVLWRAFHGLDDPPLAEPTTLKDAQITVARFEADIFYDRQIYIFVDEEPWGKVRYGETITREIKPGPHRVRAFNTLFSRTLDLDLRPAEHARLRCGNGFPRVGWLLMMFLHVTYLLVRLEREPADS